MGETFTLQPPRESQEGDWVAIPDQSLLTAKVLSVASLLMPFKDKVTNEDVWRVKWFFAITQDGEFQGRKVEGSTSTLFNEHPECKLYQWTKALFNQDIKQGYVLDTDDLIGLEGVVLVKNEGRERTDGKGTWIKNTVIDVRSLENTPVPAGNAYGIDYGEEPF